MRLHLDVSGVRGAELLVSHLRGQEDRSGYLLDGWASQIEAQLPAPKPEEPTGLGAVVRDADSDLWTRAAFGSSPWVSQHGSWFSYDSIDVAEVMSEGRVSFRIHIETGGPRTARDFAAFLRGGEWSRPEFVLDRFASQIEAQLPAEKPGEPKGVTL